MGQNATRPSATSAQVVDGGYLTPQGVYPDAPQDYNHDVVKTLIHSRKLCPFYPAVEEDEPLEPGQQRTECPICFLYYPATLNRTRCCAQPICSECFVQIKRADPTHTNPPSSEPAACPYCMTSDFGVVYAAPASNKPGTSPVQGSGAMSPSSSGLQQFAGAEVAAGMAELAAGGSRVTPRRSIKATEADVVTIDQIRPDWEAKLRAALAATTRRANRRIIMRQVGDRLIPIGISSSRAGAELPAGDGPGGAIILREGERWGREEGGGSSRRRRQAPPPVLGDGPDMEEIMMMEAMRLSLLEHEEQQRRQAAAAAAERGGGGGGSGAGAAAASSAPVSPTAAAASPTTSQPSASTFPASAPADVPSRSTAAGGSSFVAPTPTTSAPPAQPVDFGLSPSMRAQLAELIDGAPPPPPMPASAPAASSNTPTNAPAPVPTSVPSPIAVSGLGLNPSGFSPVPSPLHTPTSGQASPMRVSTTHARSPSALSTPGSTPSSPGRIGTNPNNPFRHRATGSTGSQLANETFRDPTAEQQQRYSGA